MGTSRIQPGLGLSQAMGIPPTTAYHTSRVINLTDDGSVKVHTLDNVDDEMLRQIYHHGVQKTRMEEAEKYARMEAERNYYTGHINPITPIASTEIEEERHSGWFQFMKALAVKVAVWITFKLFTSI